MTARSTGRSRRSSYGELEQRCLRTQAALESLSHDPVSPPLLLERVQEADRLTREIGSLFRALRLFSADSGEPDPASHLAGRLPLHHLRNQTEAIEKCMKLVAERGAPNPGILRPFLVAFRSRANRLERWQNLISPPSHAELKQAVGWAAGSGGREEQRLLRWIEDNLAEADDTLDYVRLAKAELHVRLKQDRDLLAAVRSHRHAPEKALWAIGEIGSHASTSRGLRHAPRDLLPEPDPVPALYDVLTASHDAVLRAEAAWALGQVGNTQATRCLLMHLFQSWGDPSLPVGVQAALIAGLGRALDPYVLYQMRGRPALLRRLYGLLLGEARQLDTLDDGLQIDMIGTLVAVELRSELAGVDLRAGSALALFLGTQAMPYVRTVAADLDEVDALRQIGLRGGLPDVLETAYRHCAHAACPVPAGLIKAVEVAAGLALPRDVAMRITRD